jgi:hypothetical protein
MSMSLNQALDREVSHSGRVKLVEEEIAPLIEVDGPLDWIFQVADIGARHQLPLEVIRELTSNLGWYARDIGQRMPSSAEWWKCADQPDPTMARRVLIYAHGWRLTFDFKFKELSDQCMTWLPDHKDDGLVAALAAFAALGTRSDRGEPLIERALSAQDIDGQCRYLCLHALWFGTNLNDQAERMIQLCDDMIGRGEDGYNLYFWRSFALRRLGRLNDALDSVDQAIALLPVGMNLVHQDYVREREMIKTSQLLNDQISEITENISARLRAESQEHFEQAKAELAGYSRSAQRIVSESLVSLVEVLGVFVALAGFLIGSGTLVFKSGGFWQHLGGIALLLAGSVAFFLVLRGIVRVAPDRQTSRFFRRWIKE